jgi:hypothetical protein
VYLATAPGFAPLRDDPRFTALLRKMRLRPEPPSGSGDVEGEQR